MIDELKRRALHRTKILAGQLRGLERMIDEEQYCVDIVTQSLAIQKSLRSLDRLIVENHLRTHAAHDLAHGGEVADRTVGELVRLYGLGAKGD
ncbi:MAG: metal-sensitive transcriptional regulator [Microbacteriaceae bacterium]